MDIFEILDPDPHENLCGAETLIWTFWLDPHPLIFFLKLIQYLFLRSDLDKYSRVFSQHCYLIQCTENCGNIKVKSTSY